MSTQLNSTAGYKHERSISSTKNSQDNNEDCQKLLVASNSITHQNLLKKSTKNLIESNQVSMKLIQQTSPLRRKNSQEKKYSTDNLTTDSKTSASSHHKRFNLAALIRFFSFRRKKKFDLTDENKSKNDKKNDENLRNRKFYRSLPSSKKHYKNNESKSKDDSFLANSKNENEDKSSPNAFKRFVRTFSFLYKRNLNSSSNQNFKRSKSMQNHSKSLSQSSALIKNLSNSNQAKSASSTPMISPKKHEEKLDENALGQHVGNRSHWKSSNSIEKKDEIDNEIYANSDKIELIDDKSQKSSLIANEIPSVDKKRMDLSINKNCEKNEKKHMVTNGLETPAVCGIQNHGNTCFINSIVQCLSNTNPFSEYFVLDYYKDDLNYRNPLTKSNQSRNELTESFAFLLKSLWSCKYSSEISLNFKKTISKYSAQYNGREQHDAQEFLLWILDKCHEDFTANHLNSKSSFDSMNRGSKKQKNKLNEKENATIEFSAKCQVNDSSSIISELFQGKLLSMVNCLDCRHCSKTIDPYLCISLPVITRLKFTIFVDVISKENDEVSMVMYGISIEAAATLRELRDKISRMIKVPEKRLILLQTDAQLGIVEFSNDAEMIQELFEDFEKIYALQTPAIPEAYETNFNTTHQMLTIVWLNLVDIGENGSIFGPLFSIVVSPDISYRKLQSKILSEMSSFLINSQEIDFDQLSNNILLRLRINDSKEKEYLSPALDLPLLSPSVEKALSKIKDRRHYRGPYHLKIIVEWDLNVREAVLVSNEEFDLIFAKLPIYIDKSVELAKECSKLNSRTTLQDCLDMYFRDESLTVENAWKCPGCNLRQQCVKKLGVCSLPDVLIIHLKRFRHISNYRRIKINTMIEYPHNGLDLLKYVDQRKYDAYNDLKISSNVSSNSTKKLTYKKRANYFLEETTYSLYGVCCHHGNMQGGHYTAYCKNSVDNCWYMFDDAKVVPVMESSVITEDAYILFYQKSYVNDAYSKVGRGTTTSTISSGYFGSSATNCSTSCNFDHWVLQAPPFTYFNSSNKSDSLPNRKSRKSVSNQQISSQKFIGLNDTNKFQNYIKNINYNEKKLLQNMNEKMVTSNNRNINLDKTSISNVNNQKPFVKNKLNFYDKEIHSKHSTNNQFETHQQFSSNMKQDLNKKYFSYENDNISNFEQQQSYLESSIDSRKNLFNDSNYTFPKAIKPKH